MQRLSREVAPLVSSHRPRRATLRDVAERAEVSLQTVSNALHHSERLNQETLRRVREAIEALGYRGNDTARMLRQGAPLASAIGWLLFDPAGAQRLELPREAAQLAGGVAAAAEHGYRVVVHVETCNTAPSADHVATLLGSLGVAGAVVVGRSAPRAAAEGSAPLVLAGAEDPNGYSSFLDEASAVARWVGELVRAGAERIAWISGSAATESSEARRRGFERGVRQHRLRAERCPMISVHSDEDHALATLLGSLPRPRALLVEGVARAHAAWRQALMLGVRVPDDLYLVAVPDDLDAVPRTTDEATPLLATCALPWDSVGAGAVDTVVALLEGDSDAALRARCCEGKPIAGQTSAPPLATAEHPVARRRLRESEAPGAARRRG